VGGGGYLTAVSVSIPFTVTIGPAGRMQLEFSFCVDLKMKSVVYFSKILILYPDKASSFFV
jgi:hypothetical protein